ncbi:MAG TPA: YciC family protein [Candidatus Binatia bacterium]|nr:YciC family protein [Candidatus Binatia bacterium]
MKNYLKEMSVGEIIDGSLRLYIANFGALFIIYLLPLVIVDFIADLGLRALTATHADLAASLESSRADVVVEQMVGNLVRLAVTILASAAITVAVSDACRGQKPGVLRSYVRVYQLIGKFLWTYLLLTVAILLGFALLIVPGVVACVFLMFAISAVMIERRGGFDALRRSIALGKGYYWRNFGVIALTLIVAIVGQLLLAFVAGMIVYMVDDVEQPGVLSKLVLSVLTSVLAPFPLIAGVLLYYDIRVRKENYDLATLTQELLGG